jgi:shikimate kinase
MGTVVLLEATPQVILDRLAGDESRPLLQGSSAEKLQRVLELFEARHPLYKETAALVVDTSALSPEAVGEEILSHVTRD